MSRKRVLSVVGGLLVAGFTLSAFAGFRLPNLLPFRDPSGIFRTLALGPVDLGNPFFDKLGTNDRSCTSCHDASEGWSITPPHLQERFQITQGKDPVFRPVDGANCPSAEVSSLKARYMAYSLLLKKGLFSQRDHVGRPRAQLEKPGQQRDPGACSAQTSADEFGTATDC